MAVMTPLPYFVQNICKLYLSCAYLQLYKLNANRTIIKLFTTIFFLLFLPLLNFSFLSLASLIVNWGNSGVRGCPNLESNLDFQICSRLRSPLDHSVFSVLRYLTSIDGL